LANCRALVASGAIERCVRSEQWKTILVLLDLLDGDLPSLDRVALLAGCPELTLVNVRVTVRASLAHIAEHGFGVALRTSHTLVHPAQREASLIVVEFRDRPDRFPAADGMAVLAGNG